MLVVVLDSLHDNFEIMTVPLLHFVDKDLEKIQQIVISIKAANIAKQAVGTIADLPLIAKKKQPERAAKLKSREEYFNYRKKGYYTKDCHSFSSNQNKKKP